MVVLYIPHIDLPSGWTHQSTDWQIANNPAFTKTSIVKESLNDEKNLTSITFDVNMEADEILYARARVICDKGVFAWSTIDVIKVEDFIKVATDTPVATLINKPIIHLAYPNNNFPTTFFRIKTDPMSSTNHADHVETTYFITDLKGNSYYYASTQDDLNNKLVDEIMLPENKLFLVSVMFKSSSNDTSPVATEAIYVKHVKKIELQTDVSNIDPSKDLAIAIKDINNFDSMEVRIYEAGLDIEDMLFQTTQESLSVVVPSSTFDGLTNSRMLIAIQVKYKDDTYSGFKYYPAKLDLS